jgi:hypothetical protein
VLAYIPSGCGSPVLSGPEAPGLASTACFAIFSSDGPVENTGVTYVTGDVGTNVGLTTGFDPLLVTGTIHPIPDVYTAQCADDLLDVYTYLDELTYDIELLYPAQFGNNLVLTPHTYLLNAATVFTDTLFLNAQGNANAVFVLKVYGAFETSTYSNVRLINGTQSKNVYWLVNGAMSINDYSSFTGTVIGNNGAIGLNTGVQLDGRALTTTGALSTNAINAVATAIPSNCGSVGVSDSDAPESSVSIYPNPFSTSATIRVNDDSQIPGLEFRMYNVLGKEVMSAMLTDQLTTLVTSSLSSGIYFYAVTRNKQTVQSGRLVSQQQ